MGIRVRFKAALPLILAGMFLAFGSAARAAVTAPPTGFTATPGNGKVILRWSAVSGATSYHLDRAPSGGTYTHIASPTWNGYTDEGVTNGTTYYYIVSAETASGQSANSSYVSAKPSATSSTSISVPTGLAAKAGNGQVSLTWSAVSGATSYHLDRAPSGGAYTHIASPTWNGYTDDGVTNGTTYYYVVSAETADGQSANSSYVSAKPEAAATTSAGLAEGFFGISWSATQASHFPSVPFGGIRAWDTDTSWAQIEGSQGNYNWTTLNQWLTTESSHGKDVMYTFGFVPHWASSGPGEACTYLPSDAGCAAPPSDVDSGDYLWKTFVTAVVNHSLSSPELHIAYYELWNEPDLVRNWSGSAAQLVTMAKDAYAIIHKLDPSAKVIGPSPSTANQYGVHFLPAYYAAGGATAQDIVGMHAYLYDGSNFSTSPAGITTTITQLRALMSKYGISSKPIWFTEGNWGNTNNSTMSNAQKAAYVAQEYMLMWSTGAVSRYYWYSWDALSFGTLWEPTTGVQPAGTAYGRVAAWLIGSTHPSNPCSESSDSTWTCTLTLANHYPAEIIWNPNLSKTIPVSSAFATYETIANSNVSAIEGSKAGIGPAPILLVGSQAN